MTRKIGALAWELVYRNRWGILATVVVAPMSVLLLETFAPEVIQPGPTEGGVVLLFMWGLLYLGVIFAYAEFSPKSLNTGFPDHVLRLPVRSSLLAAVPLVVGVAALFGYLLVWTRIEVLRIPWHPGLGLLTVVIAVSWIQAINWGLARTPLASGMALLAVTALTVLALLTVSSTTDDPLLVSRELAWGLLALLLLSGIGLAQLTVARIRRGQVVFGFEFRPRHRMPGFSLPERFRSGAQAQFRYEWRVFGWILPTVAAAMALLLFVVQFLTPEDTIEASAVVGVMFFYVASVLGLELGKSHFREAGYAMTGHWATRPLSSRALADAKLRLAATSVIVGAALILVPLLPAWYFAGTMEGIASLWERVAVSHGTGAAITLAVGTVLVLPLLSWIFCANSMALCMTGHRWLSPKCMMAVGPAIVVAIFALYKLSQNEAVVAFVAEYGMMLGLVPVVAGILLLATLTRRFGLTRDDLLRPLPLSVAGLLLLGGLAGGAQLEFLEGYRPALFVVLLNLALFTALPSITAPIALRLNRHRA